jgi:hypothetical protein
MSRPDFASLLKESFAEGSALMAAKADPAAKPATAVQNVRFWHKADIPIPSNQCPLLGVKRTLRLGRRATTQPRRMSQGA